MTTCKSVGDVLGTKFGKEKSARVMKRIKHAYQSGIRGEKLSLYLKDVLKEEGMTGSSNSIAPPIIYPHSM